MFAGVSLNFLGIEDNPMYALLIQQPRVVRLLEKRARDLGVDIRWGHELTAMRAGDDNVALTVATAGRAYRTDAGYLVGADGGRSTVRKAVGIGFPGHTSPIVSRIAHVHLPEELLVPGSWIRDPGFRPITVRPQQVRPTAPSSRFRSNRLGQCSAPIEYGWTVGSAEGPMTLDELRDSLRRVIGVDVPLEAPKGPGPHALRRLDGHELAAGRPIPGGPGAAAR